MTSFYEPSDAALIGARVLEWRKVVNLTAEQVADRAGISRTTLRKIEQGRQGVSSLSLFAVLRALGLVEVVLDALDPLGTDLGRSRAALIQRQRVRN